MNTEKIEEAASAITAELARGLSQDEEAAAAVKGHFGALDPAWLADIAARRDESENATLYGMLLYPDAGMKERLEPLFSRIACDPEEALAAGKLAGERVDGTVALFPDGMLLTLPLEPDDVREFAARLRMKDNPPQALASLVGEAFDENAAVRLLVSLRHSRLAWTRPREFFLSMLLRGLEGIESGEGEAAFSWALGFLDALGVEAEPADALSPAIRELDVRLKTARRNKEILENGNFETLMSQGVRLPYIHEETVRRELRLARLVRRAVTGISEDEEAGGERDLGAYDDPASLIDALGRLG